MLSALFGLDSLLYRVIALYIAVIVHDTVQASVAFLLGDRTAKEAGRLTLSPVPHMSALGVIACLFGPFGWSKPIPVQAEALRGNPRLSAIAVYASGLFANLVLGVAVWWVLFEAPYHLMDGTMPSWVSIWLRGVIQWTYIFSIMFVFLQLVPVYPMDVWKGIRIFLPKRWEHTLKMYDKLGGAVLLVFVASPFGQFVLNRCFETGTGIIMNLYSLV